MREMDVSDITQAVKKLCMSSNFNLGDDVRKALQIGLEKEESPAGKAALEQILENDRIAENEKVALCQDTGFAVVFLELGQDLHIAGGDLNEAVNEGVRQGYREGYLRKSIVEDPLRRKNTGDNTPAVIHTTIVPGDKVKITLIPKGAGGENMSSLKMMDPAAGAAGIKDFVVERVEEAGANPCPPIIVGVGIGGTFEGVALLAKKALLRPAGSKNPDPFYAVMEEELLERINRLGIGTQGFGGRITALAVHIETFPCHISSLPVAVNIQCHSARHARAEL